MAGPAAAVVDRGRPRTVWGWALYDFANSPYTTLVVTFIYATYFTKAIAPDEVTGTALWSRAIAATGVVVALLSPLMGAIADRGGYRKACLVGATAVCVVGCIGLYGALPGEVAKALTWLIVGNIAFELGMVFYNAYLPDVALPERIGRVSGLGWGLGYLGGLLALGLALVLMVQPEQPCCGLSKEAGQHIRATNLLVAAWFALFSLPTFFLVRDRRLAAPPGLVRAAREGYGQLLATFREIRQYRQIVRFLIARLLYNDGLVTIFAFGGIYAGGTFGFSFQEVMIFGIVLNVAAGAGALAGGWVDDRLGGKRTLLLTVAALSVATAIAVLAPNRAWFWAAGILVGLTAGPNQAASRSLMGRFVPPDKENEFYGFFAFSGKFTAFLGPLALGALTQAFDSQRAGVAVILVLFLAGGIALLGVDEAAGRRQAAGETT